METKITSSTVRIMLSHSYCNFEISSTLENPEGISTKEIEDCRQVCQALAVDAVNEYRKNPQLSPKEELKRIENKIEALKAEISESKANVITDPVEIEKVEKLPLYSEKKAKNK